MILKEQTNKFWGKYDYYLEQSTHLKFIFLNDHFCFQAVGYTMRNSWLITNWQKTTICKGHLIYEIKCTNEWQETFNINAIFNINLNNLWYNQNSSNFGTMIKLLPFSKILKSVYYKIVESSWYKI